MSRVRVALVVAWGLAAGPACREAVGQTAPSSSYVFDPEAGALGSGAGTGAVTSVERFVPSVVYGCPEARPDENTPCAAEGAACEYGASVDLSCNTQLVCADFATSPGASVYVWTSARPEPCAAFACPKSAARAVLDGRACSGEAEAAGLVADGVAPALDAAVSPRRDLQCPVADGVCVCRAERRGAGGNLDAGGSDGEPFADGGLAWRWTCLAPPALPCPPVRPHVGQACDAPAWCDYGACVASGGVVLECVDRAWRIGQGACP